MKPPAKPRRRNPEARELHRNPLFRAKTTKSVDDTTAQQDAWNRRAKHRRKPKAGSDPE